MARRAQSKIPIGVLFGVLAIVLVAGGIGYQFLTRTDSQSYSALNIEEFRQNSAAMRGNQYELEGTVARRDRVTNDGQVITLTVRHEGRDEPIQVLIPTDTTSQNIEVGYRLRFVVEINEQGWPRAVRVQRS